jgi:hypothetical protein
MFYQFRPGSIIVPILVLHCPVAVQKCWIQRLRQSVEILEDTILCPAPLYYISVVGWAWDHLIYKSKHGVCLCGQKLGSAWKILPVTARSLWSW